MASWREVASQQAQEDLDGLMDQSFPFAQRMLAADGEFFPYAVGLSRSGEVRMFAADPGESEHPPSTEVLRGLVDGLRSERNALRAVAVTSDVRVAGLRRDPRRARTPRRHRDLRPAPVSRGERRRHRIRHAQRRPGRAPRLGLGHAFALPRSARPRSMRWVDAR